MMKITFEEEELIVLSMFMAPTPREAVKAIEAILPYVQQDADLTKLVISSMEKVKRLSDVDYSKLDLESYHEEPEEA